MLGRKVKKQMLGSKVEFWLILVFFFSTFCGFLLYSLTNVNLKRLYCVYVIK